MTLGFVVAWKYGLAVANGVLRVDDSVIRDLEDALLIAEASIDDNVLAASNGRSLPCCCIGDLRRIVSADLSCSEQVLDMCSQERFPLSELPLMNLYAARQRARSGDLDGAMPVMRKTMDDLFVRGQFMYFIPAVAVLMEVLVDRAAAGDLAEAEAVVDRLAAIPGADGWVVRDVMLLRLRALLANARGDEARYCDYRDRYRATATSLGFEGHMAWAAALP